MPLVGQDAINHLVGALRRVGFRDRYRSATGTRYLFLPGLPFELRVSDHQWSGWSKQRQCQVLCSKIVRSIEPKDLDEEAARLKERFLEIVAIRTGRAEPRSGR